MNKWIIILSFITLGQIQEPVKKDSTTLDSATIQQMMVVKNDIDSIKIQVQMMLEKIKMDTIK